MKIGLFFGSFNPIHVGHLIIANYMAENTDLDEVWLMVTPQNPLKNRRQLLNEYDRLEMVRLATENNDKLRASDFEFSLPRPSFTIDTLTHLKDRYPQHEFALIMGSDTVNSIPKWKNADLLQANYDIYAYPRPNAALTHKPQRLQICDTPLMEISASYIRRSLRKGKSARYFIPENVLDYILKWGYYQS